MTDQGGHIFLIGYDEIGLKGKKRSYFIDALFRNISNIIGISTEHLSHKRKRVYLKVPSDTDFAGIIPKLKKVFGIKWFAPAEVCNFDFENLKRISLDLANQHLSRGDRTFKVEARRSFKEYPLTSHEINDRLGEEIRTRAGMEVDVHNPDVTFNVEIRKPGAYVYTDRFEGPGGLPTGTGGKALVLYSGGIDSPVAAWRLMKRGLSVDVIHFHSPPYTGEKVLKKVKDSAVKLQQWSGQTITVYVSRFTRVQEVIAERIPDRYWTIMHRRFMLRIAEKIARKYEIGALATGDSLGQVASQTLSNLAVVEDAAQGLVLQPLLGFDKIEIVELAKRIGTFDISTQPYEDCCVLFAPDHPVTNAAVREVREVEEELDIESLVQHAVDHVETVSLGREEVKI